MRSRSLSFALIAPAALLAVALVAGACADAPIDSGVRGEVRIGPVNPVEQPGVDNTAPYSAKLAVKLALDGEVVAETVSGEDGLFVIILAPGDYVLVPENGDPLPVAEPQAFTVTADRFTTVTVAYDSGIR